MLRRLLIPFLLLASCEDDPSPTTTPQAPRVEVVHPVAEPVLTFEILNGRAAAAKRVDVRARVPGILTEQRFAPGDPVSKGDVLFVIEPAPYEAALESAKAQLREATVNRDLAQVFVGRVEEVYEQGAASDWEVEEAKARLAVAEAEIALASTGVEQARLDLSYTTVSAPIDGRLSRELVSVGNLVGSGDSTHLTTIIVDDPVHVYFRANERLVLEYLRRNPRQPSETENPKEIELSLADGEMFEHLGRIDFAEQFVEQQTGTMEIRVIFDNPEGLVVPGMFVRVHVPRQPFDGFTIPEVCLQRDQAGEYVLVVDEQGVAQRRALDVRARLDGRIGVDEGLDPSDRVISRGLQRVRPGAPVEIVSN